MSEDKTIGSRQNWASNKVGLASLAQGNLEQVIPSLLLLEFLFVKLMKKLWISNFNKCYYTVLLFVFN